MTVEQTDLMLVNRAGKSYKIEYGLLKENIIKGAGGAIVSETEPVSDDLHEGDFWYKPSTDELYVWVFTETTGIVTNVTLQEPGSGYTTNVNDVETLGGFGNDLTVDITAGSGGNIGSIAVNSGGHGYTVGDRVWIVGAGHGNASARVSSVGSEAAGSWQIVGGDFTYMYPGSDNERTLYNRLLNSVSVLDFIPDDHIEDIVAGTSTYDASEDIDKAIEVSSSQERWLDFGGLTLNYATGFSRHTRNNVRIKNGAINFIGGATNTAGSLMLDITGSFQCRHMDFHCNNVISRGVHLQPHADDAKVYVEGCNFKDVRQTDTNSFLACLLFCNTNSAGFDWAEVNITNCTFRNVDSIGSSKIGRGLIVNSDQSRTTIDNCRFFEIGPIDDGDGIFCSGRGTSKTTISNCYFEDCYKRGFKSQSKNAYCTNNHVVWTKDVGTSNGMSAGSIQAGGVVDGLQVVLPVGSQIKAAVTTQATESDHFIDVRNVTIHSADPNFVLPTIVSIGADEDIIATETVMADIHCFTKINHVLSLSGGTTSSQVQFPDVVITNVYAPGFESAGTDSNTNKPIRGLVKLTKKGGLFTHAMLQLKDIRIGIGSAEAIYILNNGNQTGSARGYIETADNVQGIRLLSQRQDQNANDVEEFFNFIRTGGVVVENATLGTDNGFNSFGYSLAENKADTFKFEMKGKGGAKVMVAYSSRNSTGTRLYTEGYVHNGGSNSTYIETLSGDKSSTNTGAISIVADGSNGGFEVRKTAGTTSASGVLQIMILGPVVPVE